MYVHLYVCTNACFHVCMLGCTYVQVSGGTDVRMAEGRYAAIRHVCRSVCMWACLRACLKVFMQVNKNGSMHACHLNAPAVVHLTPSGAKSPRRYSP